MTVGRFLAWTAGLAIVGGLLGAVLFPLVGWLFNLSYPAVELMQHGIRNLGFYFLIWSPGIGIVMCYRDLYHRFSRMT